MASKRPGSFAPKGLVEGIQGLFPPNHVRSILVLSPGSPLFEDPGVPGTQWTQQGIDTARQTDGDPDLEIGQEDGNRPGEYKDHKMSIILFVDQGITSSVLDQVAMVHHGDAQKN